MTEWLTIELYPADENEAEQMDQLLQEIMAEEGVRGSVSVSWVLPELLERFGITRLPAVAIDDVVVLQGRTPTRVDLIRWFDDLVPAELRAPRRRPEQVGWPSSLEKAIAWLIDGMREKEKLGLIEADDDVLAVANGPGGWGQGIRNGFGLWAGNRQLLRDCGTDDAEQASLVIIRAVRESLKQSAAKKAPV